jgi:hypothetical protein
MDDALPLEDVIELLECGTDGGGDGGLLGRSMESRTVLAW